MYVYFATTLASLGVILEKDYGQYFPNIRQVRLLVNSVEKVLSPATHVTLQHADGGLNNTIKVLILKEIKVCFS